MNIIKTNKLKHIQKKIFDNIPSYLVAFYFINLLLFYIYSELIIEFLLIFLGFVSLVYSLIRVPIKNKFQYFLFGIILSSYFISIIVNQNINIFGYVASIQFIGISLLIINFNLNLKIITFTFYIHIFFYLFHFLLGSNPNEIFINASRNLISVTLIIQVTLITLLSYKQNRLISLVPSVFLLLFSLWAAGRSGIISASIILFSVYFFGLNNQKIYKRMKNFLVLVLILLILSLSIIYFDFVPLGSIKEGVDRVIYSGFSDIGRSMILQEYFKITFSDFKSFIFGVNINSSRIFNYFSNNLHNSFLNGHANFGIFGLITIFLTLVVSIYNLIKKKNLLILGFLLAILLRVLTDSLAFPGPMDVIFYSLSISSIIGFKNNNSYKNMKE